MKSKVCLDKVAANSEKLFRMKAKMFCRCFLLITIAATFAFDFVAKADTTTNLYLATPGSSWSLEIDTPGFNLEESNFSQDGTAARLKAVNTNNGVILSVFLEKAQTAGDAKQCREFYWRDAQKSPFKKDDLKMSETNSVALVEYTVKEYSGMMVNQKNMNAYLSQNGYWVDVHISKVEFKPEDEAMLQSIINSIRFNDSFAPTVIEWATWGSFFMSKEKYADAVRCNEKAWELEKSHPALNHKQQVFLLNDLINGYGNLGNNMKAKELSELGLQKEPDYPSFYYDLACSYAELGDKDKALENLKKAFQNRAKLFSGDVLADPRADSSFSKYSNDPDFVKFFAEVNK